MQGSTGRPGVGADLRGIRHTPKSLPLPFWFSQAVSEVLCYKVHEFSGSVLDRAAMAKDLAHGVRESWKFLECW